jgi:hypothetical protein
VDTTLDEDKTELGVLVLTVSLKMLTNLNSLLDKHVKILGDLGGKSVSLEDTNNLLSSNGMNRGDTVGITKHNTNLRRTKTLLGKLAYVLLNISGRDLGPRGRGALVRLGTLRDTLSRCVHTSHAKKLKKKYMLWSVTKVVNKS